MNILITVSTFFPRKDGVQAVTEYLSLGLLSRGHSVTIVTSSVPGQKSIDDYMGIKIIRVDVTTKYALYFGNKKKYQDLIIDLSSDFDVLINVCTQNALTDYLYPVLDQIKCKKILHMHGMNDFHWALFDFSSPKAFIYKLWKTIRWGVFYHTRDFKKYDRIIQLHQFDDGYKYFAKHYGINCDILENAAQDAFYSHDVKAKNDLYAICVANYTERKNQKFILESFYKAASDSLKLVFIGSRDNDYLKSLKSLNAELSAKYGSKKVEFLVDVDRDRTIELVKGSSLYLLGSTWEAFPISIIEAMAAGVPFISTNVGIARYLPGGVIVKSADEMSYWIEVFEKYPDIASLYGTIGRDYYISNLRISDKVDALEVIISE